MFYKYGKYDKEGNLVYRFNESLELPIIVNKKDLYGSKEFLPETAKMFVIKKCINDNEVNPIAYKSSVTPNSVVFEIDDAILNNFSFVLSQ